MSHELVLSMDMDRVAEIARQARSVRECFKQGVLIGLRNPTDAAKRYASENNILLINSETKAKRGADGLYTIEMDDGSDLPAVLFSDAFSDNEIRNQTHFPSDLGHELWTGVRGAGRPEILYKLRPDQDFRDGEEQALRELRSSTRKQLVIEPWFEQSTVRVIINEELKPVRFLPKIPITFSTETPGWYIEALFRMNPLLKLEDILERMPSTNPRIKRMSRLTLTKRRAKDRHLMRITNWKAETDRDNFWEQVIKEDLDDWARTNNSTARLIDLDNSRLSLLTELQKIPDIEMKRDRQLQIKLFRKTIAAAKKAGYPDGHKFITDVEARIEQWQDEMAKDNP